MNAFRRVSPYNHPQFDISTSSITSNNGLSTHYTSKQNSRFSDTNVNNNNNSISRSGVSALKSGIGSYVALVFIFLIIINGFLFFGLKMSLFSLYGQEYSEQNTHVDNSDIDTLFSQTVLQERSSYLGKKHHKFVFVVNHLKPLVQLNIINSTSALGWYPSHIVQALKEWKAKSSLKKSEIKDNSVALSSDDVEYARTTSLIRPLYMDISDICTVCTDRVSKGTDIDNVIKKTSYFCNTTNSAFITFHALKDYVQEAALTGYPIVVDFGCVIGYVFASTHKTSTVICVHEYGQRLRQVEEEDLPNLYHIYSEGSFLDAKFKQFFELCNLFTIVFALQGINAGSDNIKALHSLLKTVLPTSAVVYAAIPTIFSKSATVPTVPVDFSSNGFLTTGISLDTETAVIGNISSSIVIEIQHLMPSRSDNILQNFSIVEYKVHFSQRRCRKTWNSNLKQWGKYTSVTFLDGLVKFQVFSSSEKNGKDKVNKMRVIDPLQYIHSINMDTLLGAGLSESARVRLLGMMIATPRYSDPLPHNWVIAGGGRVLRIDKYDDKYDSKVDESKGYWGKSTLGYLHLLAVHLCISVDKVGAPQAQGKISFPGLPSVINKLSVSCQTYCLECIGLMPVNGDMNNIRNSTVNNTLCSYLPKGKVPCPSCVMCGSGRAEGLEAVESNVRVDKKEKYPNMEIEGCMEQQVKQMIKERQSLAERVEMKPKSCHVSYSSLDSARKVWVEWEREDLMGWKVLLNRVAKH